MGKIKMPKGSPTTDMTPLVDLGFLLVTFFMLSAKFRTTEPVQTDPPYATETEEIPENVMLITIDKEGRVFYDLSGKDVRTKLLAGMAERHPEALGTLNAEQTEQFIGLGTMGMPVASLPQFLSSDNETRDALNKQTKGIPADSLNNELADWIQEGYEAFRADAMEKGWDKEKMKKDGLNYAIKADAETEYAKVEKVIDVFRDKNIFQFEIITNLEKEPTPEGAAD